MCVSVQANIAWYHLQTEDAKDCDDTRDEDYNQKSVSSGSSASSHTAVATAMSASWIGVAARSQLKPRCKASVKRSSLLVLL